MGPNVPGFQSPRRGARRWLVGIGLVLLLGGHAVAQDSGVQEPGAQDLPILEVVGIRWGFHGRVHDGSFNPLEVVVHNRSTRSYRGEISLYQGTPGSRWFGAPHVEIVDLVPGGQRRLQFLPYINPQRDTWSVRWGRGKNAAVALPEARLGPPARVLLTSPESPAPSGFRGFPAAGFPATVVALTGLELVVLDHVPEWRPAQARALLDWVHLGGELHLLRGDFGDHPTFGGELRALDQRSSRFAVGSGVVVRHDATRRELPAGLQDVLRPEVRPGKKEDLVDPEDLDERIQSTLAELHQPDHAWGFIFFLTVVWLVIVGPVNGIIGRRVRDFRVALAFLLLATALFSTLFYYTGRRGFGEEQALRSITYARSLGENRWVFTQWGDYFATREGHYAVRPGTTEWSSFDTVLDTERVDGKLRVGPRGEFQFQLRPFTWREFVHGGTAVGESLVERVTGPLGFVAGPGFPPQPIHMYLYRDGRFYPLLRRRDQPGVQPGDRLGSDGQGVRELPFRHVEDVWIGDEAPEARTSRLRSALFHRIVDRAIRDAEAADELAGRSHLFVLVEKPGEFVSHIGAGVDEGAVVWHVVLDPPPQESPR